LLGQIEKNKKLKKEEASFMRLLFRMLSACALSAAENAGSIIQQGESIGGAGQDEGAMLEKEVGKESKEASREKLGPLAMEAQIDEMMPDAKYVAGYQRRKRQREIAACAFVQLLPSESGAEGGVEGGGDSVSAASATLSLSAQLRLCPRFRSAEIVEEFLSKGPLNEFACFDLDGEACGCAFFPAAAMVNHSCVPNTAAQLQGANMCFYATRELKVGDEITQTYTNLSSGKNGFCAIGGNRVQSRRDNLQISWGFACRCVRCRLEPHLKTATMSATGVSPTTAPDRTKGEGGEDGGGDWREQQNKRARTAPTECELELEAALIADFDEHHVCNCGGVLVPEEVRGRRPDSNCKCNSWNLRAFDSVG
jgi:hypothetical protein